MLIVNFTPNPFQQVVIELVEMLNASPWREFRGEFSIYC